MQTSKNARRSHLYEIETAYARRILAASPGSAERKRLIAEGYDAVLGLSADAIQGSCHGDVAMRLVRRLVAPGSRILDIGCGFGDLVMALRTAGYDARGIDVSSVAVAQAKKRLGNDERSATNEEPVFWQAELSDVRTVEAFDLIVMDNVFEHLPPDEVGEALRHVLTLLTPGGRLLIFTPHPLSGPHDISGLFLPLGSVAQGFHFKEWTFAELEDALRAAGFGSVQGFPFHPRLLARIGIVPSPSVRWNARIRHMERLFRTLPFSWLFRLSHDVSRALVGLCCPVVCVANKKPR